MKTYQAPTSGELYQLAGYSDKPDIEAILLSQSDLISEKLDGKINSGYSCVFNWHYMQYVFMGSSVKNILGYPSDVFLENGANFALSIIHPEDMLHLRKLHLAIFNYYYSIPVAQRIKLRFSYNLRVKTANNDYIHILRQSTFTEFTVEGKPTIEYINSTDITGFKYDNSINLTIHQLSDSGTYILCYEQEFPETYTNLTEREVQVLELVRLGYTTKEIACHLYLAIETVKSHRKHIIAKTGAYNMAGAINMVIHRML